jgi:hypothetical protein
MSKAPWFKFYAADYLSSPFVQSLDPEQELWYLRLIIASAISLPRGCLPLANGKLWRLAKALSEEYFEQNAGPILAKFERDELAGVYRVPKVASQQLLTSSELSLKRSEAGKRGAANRWQTAIRDDGNLPSEAMAKAKQNIADSDSDSDSDLDLDLERKPSAANAPVADDSDPVDPRHASIRELIQQLHLKTFRVKCQWDGSEGKALDRLLSANPSWSQEQIAQMVRNRFDSEGIPSDRPRKWLPNIGGYAAGVQDRFNRPKGVHHNGNGNGNRAERRQASNLTAREAARAAIMAD